MGKSFTSSLMLALSAISLAFYHRHLWLKSLLLTPWFLTIDAKTWGHRTLCQYIALAVPKKMKLRDIWKYPGWKAGVLSVHYLSNKAQMREEMETNYRRKLQGCQRKAESLFNIFGRTILSKPKRCDILLRQKSQIID